MVKQYQPRLPKCVERWRQRRKRTTQVDGWGEITTPYGTFSALRIHHRIVESDSIRVSVGGFNNWVGIPIPVAHEYEWRAVGEKEPILVIKTNEISGGENVTAIEYGKDIIIVDCGKLLPQMGELFSQAF